MKSQKSEIHCSKLYFALKRYHFHFILVFFYISPSFLQAQLYKPIDTADKVLREKFIEKYMVRDAQFLLTLKQKYGKDSKELITELKDFSKDFIQNIKDGQYVFDDRFTSKAESVLAHISKANHLDEQNTCVIISKDPTLNAFCLPNGTFVINMGVFYWLNNVDQLAGVLSHELSHKLLDHSIKFQMLRLADDKSQQAQNALKSVKSLKYNRREAAFQLYKNRLYALGEERRKNEYQADSMGYILLKKTDYNCNQFIDALRFMEKYDTLVPEPVKDDIYRQVFDLPDLKFREEWLTMEDLSGYDYSLWKSRFDADSASSHPQLDDRIKTLENLNPELLQSRDSKADSSFLELHRIAELEQVPNLYFLEEYGLSIYICLKRIQQEKDIDYYKQWLGKNFTKIWDARKKYQLNRYLDTVDPKNQSPGYQKYLNFMWNLSLEEIRTISDYYTTNYR